MLVPPLTIASNDTLSTTMSNKKNEVVSEMWRTNALYTRQKQNDNIFQVLNDGSGLLLEDRVDAYELETSWTLLGLDQ